MNRYQQQAQDARNTPGLSIDDGRFVDSWLVRAPQEDELVTRRWVAERRAQNNEKAKDVLARLDQVQDDLVDIRKSAERNELPYKELTKAQRKAARERHSLERVYESLVASEDRVKAMEADPVGYLESLYRRYPALPDRRPNLARDLAEDQRKRGVKRAFGL